MMPVPWTVRESCRDGGSARQPSCLGGAFERCLNLHKLTKVIKAAHTVSGNLP